MLLINNQGKLLSIMSFLSVLAFTVSVLALTRQFPIFQLSKLISISLIFVFVFSVPFLIKNFINSDKKIKYLFMVNVVFLIFLFVYSIWFEHNSLSLALRFLMILALLLTAFFLPAKKIYIQVFIFFAVLHSVFLILFEIYIVLFGDPEFAANIRQTVMSMGMGDVYTYNQYFYRIQIKGNSVLPIAFLVSLYAIQSKRIKISVVSLLFVGTIVAGNLAFILAIFFFVGIYAIILFFFNKRVSAYLKQLFNNRKRIMILSGIVIAIIIIVSILLYPYINAVIVRKMEYSIPARFDQVMYLMKDLAESPTTLLLGRGLGNVINIISDYRDYRNNYYFELQTFYIINQVGILYFILFLITKITFVIKFWRNQIAYLIYLSYVLYAFTNPYLFDTTNILVLIVLSSLSSLYLKEGNSSGSKL